MRCRLAHNNDTNRRRRALTEMQRYEFLTLLRTGTSIEDAAERVGVTAHVLAQVASRDGELRAALDGMTVQVQVAAQRAEWLAALVRCGGNQKLADAQAGLSHGLSSNWLNNDPEFSAAVAAIRTWVKGSQRVPRKPYVRMSDESLARLREMWVDGATGDEIAVELGTNRMAVTHWRKQLGLPSRTQRGRMLDLAPEFRELWTAGASYPEIRGKLGISDPTISEWRKKLGLPARVGKRA